MFRRVVCATDFSTLAEAGMRVAIELARQSGGTVELVHAWGVPSAYAHDLGRLIPADMLDRARRAVLEQLESRARDVGATATLLQGEPASAIVQHVDDTEADLLVTTTHGRSAIAHVLLGSVAERLVRTSSAPVLVVPRGPSVVARLSSPKRLLVPVNLSPSSGEALKLALTIAQQAGARVDTVYAWGTPFQFATGGQMTLASEAEERKRYEDFVASVQAGRGEVNQRFMRMGPPADAIREVATERDADLVVMATAGHTAAERLLLGSVTERTLRTLGRAVLTCRPRHAPAQTS